MSQKLNTESQLTAYIQKRKRRKKMFLTLSVLSFLVAVSTFRLLTLPAMTLTEDPNTMEICADPASSEAIPSGGDAESLAEAAETGELNMDAISGTETGFDTERTSDPAGGADADAASSAEPGSDTEHTSDPVAGADADADAVSGGETGPSTESTSDPAAGTDAGLNPELTIIDTAPALAAQPAEYTYDDSNGLVVTAVPQDPTSIPEGAEFHADRITQESDPDRYVQLQQLLEEKGGLVNSAVFSAYDIYFLVDGQKVEPDGGTVDVTIVDTTDAAIAPENAQVFHVLNENTDPSLQELTVETAADSSAAASVDSLETSDAEQGITFTTDSFSVFVAVKPTIPAGSQLIYRQVPSEEKVFTESGYYDASQPLGIAGNFSLVAFHTLYIDVDCCGNILANTLTFGRSTDFGTKNLPQLSEVSYVQHYPGVESNGPRSSDQLVLGSLNTVSLTEDNSNFTINGKKIAQPTTLWQDRDTDSTPFINLEPVKNESEALSASLAEIQDQNISVSLVNTGNQTLSGVTLTSANDIGVYNTKATDLSGYSNCNVRGLTFNAGKTALTGGTVIINVDCSGWNTSTAFTMPECKIYPTIGDPLELKEVTTFTNGRVLWNFTNCNGMTIQTQLEYCSILAPGATIVVDKNVNGTIIADNITIKAESHRDDFIGELPQPPFSYTVSKVWKDINGNVLTGTDLTGWSVTVKLRDKTTGTFVGDPQTLNSVNNWSYTWSSGLDRSKTYTAVETAVYLDGDTSTNRMDQYTSTSADSNGGCTITNSPKTLPFELPDTGGPGTYLYTAAGLSLLVPSCLLLFWRWNRQRRDDS
ncbi:MAG: choice-of-anchor A family protein [Lawsonibacter sp.]|nr:choice-of-anchor A family protein [Lawsonibacter sp.]